MAAAMHDSVRNAVAEAAIFACRLGIVAALAQRLPVAAQPEHQLVATMRDDVIDDRCCRH